MGEDRSERDGFTIARRSLADESFHVPVKPVNKQSATLITSENKRIPNDISYRILKISGEGGNVQGTADFGSEADQLEPYVRLQPVYPPWWYGFSSASEIQILSKLFISRDDHPKHGKIHFGNGLTWNIDMPVEFAPFGFKHWYRFPIAVDSGNFYTPPYPYDPSWKSKIDNYQFWDREFVTCRENNYFNHIKLEMDHWSSIPVYGFKLILNGVTIVDKTNHWDTPLQIVDAGHSLILDQEIENFRLAKLGYNQMPNPQTVLSIAAGQYGQTWSIRYSPIGLDSAERPGEFTWPPQYGYCSSFASWVLRQFSPVYKNDHDFPWWNKYFDGHPTVGNLARYFNGKNKFIGPTSTSNILNYRTYNGFSLVQPGYLASMFAEPGLYRRFHFPRSHNTFFIHWCDQNGHKTDFSPDPGVINRFIGIGGAQDTIGAFWCVCLEMFSVSFSVDYDVFLDRPVDIIWNHMSPLEGFCDTRV